MSDQGFELLPADDRFASAADLLDAAEASLTRDVPLSPDAAREPLGFGFRFDWERRRLVRRGVGVVRAVGIDAVAQRCLVALHAHRFQHAGIPVDFGMEDPDRLIGELPRPATVEAYVRDLRRALLDVDRVTSVEDVRARVDGDSVVVDFRVVVDGGRVLSRETRIRRG